MMTDDQNDIILIDRFLSNELSNEERNAFDRKLEDPTFKKLLADEKTIRKGIEYSTLKNLSADLASLEASLPEIEIQESANETTRNFWNTTTFKIAASLLLLLSVSLVIYRFSNQQPDTRLAFETNFSPYPNEFYITKRGDPISDSDKAKAFQYYDAKEYKEALIYFERIPANEKDGMIDFYSANTYLASGDSEKAAEIFEVLINKHQIIFIDQSKWYLGLAYLKSKKIDKAKKVFHDLAQGNNAYNERATEILEEIN
jgi:tetratricopeptide (TPR) repeat protein